MRRIFVGSLFATLFALVGCSTEEVKLSCIRTVGFDTRDTFDGVKFIVNLNASDKGKGLIKNLMTGEKQER